MRPLQIVWLIAALAVALCHVPTQNLFHEKVNQLFVKMSNYTQAITMFPENIWKLFLDDDGREIAVSFHVEEERKKEAWGNGKNGHFQIARKKETKIFFILWNIFNGYFSGVDSVNTKLSRYHGRGRTGQPTLYTGRVTLLNKQNITSIIISYRLFLTSFKLCLGSRTNYHICPEAKEQGAATRKSRRGIDQKKISL